MKKTVILFVLLFALLTITGCYKTKVVYYTEEQRSDFNNLQEKNEETAINESAAKTDVLENNTSAFIIEEKNQTENTKKKIIRDVEDKEYVEIKRTDDGILYIESAKPRSYYSKNEIAELLIKAYTENCDYFKKYVRNRVFLKYAGEFGYKAELSYYRINEIKSIVVDYEKINKTFEICS